MTHDREPGPTFALQDIGWIDFESRSPIPIEAGTYRYASEADAIILAAAFGDGPVLLAAVENFDGPLRWENLPVEIHDFHARVLRGEAKWAAWNAGFDRAMWNYGILNSPFMEPDHIIDVMVQATASGLAPDLKRAAIQSASICKDEEGEDLIKLFCTPEGLKGIKGTPQTHPNEWRQFLSYAGTDIEAMRSVFLGTRQLAIAEWREYWAMEKINQRGVCIDLPMVKHAAELAAEDKVRSSATLAALTGGKVETVDQVAKMTAWLLENLPEEGRAILLKREEETDDDGNVTKPAKFSLPRRKVQRLIALCQAEGIASPADVLRVLQIRLYGGSKTPAKFKKMLEQHVDGVLLGQYVFSGAPQTGRASSRGVQVHNLARDSLADEVKLIDCMVLGAPYETFVTTGGDDPVARKLSLLIRPAFVPAPENVFVWSDWSQIEARIVPWLASHYPGARQRLQLFQAVDEDPSIPDLYTRTAAEISQLPIEAVTKPIRQRGKVAELALGFCGGIGALQSMAASYGMHLTDDDAKTIVSRWRQANPWVLEYSQELWNAMTDARRMPGQYFGAGRIGFLFLKDYLGGSLLCLLPSGRFLTYRALHETNVNILDDDDNVIGTKRELTFSRGHGRVIMWPGLLVENFTQATAADILRGTLVRLENEYDPDNMAVRLHTHDEILVETPEHEADLANVCLHDVMVRGFDWSEGLPLMAEETAAYYYTKDETSHGIDETKPAANG